MGAPDGCCEGYIGNGWLVVAMAVYGSLGQYCCCAGTGPLETCIQMHLHTAVMIRMSPRTFRRCLDHCSAPASSSGQHTYRHLDSSNPPAAAGAAGSKPFQVVQVVAAAAPSVKEALGYRLRNVKGVAVAAGDDMPPGALNLGAVANSLIVDLDLSRKGKISHSPTYLAYLSG
jgi:hypothetical protein